MADEPDDVDAMVEPVVPSRHRWLAGLLGAGPGDRVVDLGCGTGASLVQVAPDLHGGGGPGVAVGVDASLAVLGRAADALAPAVAAGTARVLLVQADLKDRLPFPDAAFDGALVGFGVRNLADLDAGLAEAARVLKPGARFVILEFATPRFAPLRAAYLFYFRHILPAVGRMVSKHRDAYTYLPESVLAFPEPEALARRFAAAGFHDVGFELLSGGICAVHHGTR